MSGSANRSRPPSYAHAAPPEQFRTKQHELDTLLGLDSDAYINENLGKYEDLKKKWANSSMEEWNGGAQGKSDGPSFFRFVRLTWGWFRNRKQVLWDPRHGKLEPLHDVHGPEDTFVDKVKDHMM